MPYVNAPGIVHMGAIWTQDNQNVENTYHYHLTGTIDPTVLAAIAQTYVTWATANLNLWSTNCNLLKIYMRDLSTQFGATLDLVPATTLNGTKVGESLPNNVAWAMKRQSGLAGRANRGRLYWFGIVDADLDGPNRIAGSRATNMITKAETLRLSEFTDNGATEVIFHKKLGTGTPVVGYSSSDRTLDAQRRRLPDHNRHH